MALSFSKDRLASTIRATPALTDKVKDSKSRIPGNTILHKKSRRSYQWPARIPRRPWRPVRSGNCPDGRDGQILPASAGGEAKTDQISGKRTNTFLETGKKIKVSTPTIKGESQIEKEFLSVHRKNGVFLAQVAASNSSLRMGADSFSDATMECSFCGEHNFRNGLKQQTGKYIAKIPGSPPEKVVPLKRH